MVGSKKNSSKKQTRSQRDKEIINKLARIHLQMRKRFGTPKCKKGEIIREGFIKTHKKQEIEVPPTCIKDRGSRGKGKRLFVLNKGVLSCVGYNTKKTKIDRHKSLTKAIYRDGPLSVYKKLIVLSTLNKNTNLKLSKLYHEDAVWVKKTFM